MRLSRILTAAILTSSYAFSQTGAPDVSSFAYTGPTITKPYTPPAQSTLKGLVQLAIKLQDPPLVVAVGPNANSNELLVNAVIGDFYGDNIVSQTRFRASKRPSLAVPGVNLVDTERKCMAGFIRDLCVRVDWRVARALQERIPIPRPRGAERVVVLTGQDDDFLAVRVVGGRTNAFCRC